MAGESDLGKYLKEIGRYRLLTREEEGDLARQGLDETLSPDQRRTARQRMITSNLRLVVNIAKQYTRSGVPLADLIAEGNVGLMKAIRRFDPNRGTRISTYATFWIRQSIQLAVREHRKGVRLPAYMTGAMAKVREVQGQLSQKLQREPGLAEVHEALDPETRAVLKHAVDSDQFGRVVNLEEVLKLQHVHAVLVDEGDASRPTGAEMEEVMDTIARHLDNRETRILRLRYGLNGEAEALTLSQIGLKLGITRERVRQLEARAIGKLQRELRKMPA